MSNENWAWTDFAADDALYVEIECLGTFQVVQYSSSFAVNEIPRAVCMLAIGRDARTSKYARLHSTGMNLQQMLKAKVFFRPRGAWDTDGTNWPGTKKCVFEGFYVGMAYTKITGKMQPTLHLIHWLADLGFSSTLSANQHPSNPTCLVTAAVTPSVEPINTSGLGEQGVLVGCDVANTVIEKWVERGDLWHGIKEMFYQYAQIDRFRLGKITDEEGGGTKTDNNRALNALKKFECSTESCPSLGYKYAYPMELDTKGGRLVADSCGKAISESLCQSFAASTFWDQLVGVYCPMFCMTVIPMVDRALVVADTPAYNVPWQKTIKAGDYDNIDLSGMISRPLQGVGVVSNYATLAGTGRTDNSDSSDNTELNVGGTYAESSVHKGDGTWMVIPAPAWLEGAAQVGVYSGVSCGIDKKVASNSSTTATDTGKADDPTPVDIISGDSLSKLFSAYAHAVYVTNMLRGRSASISGKLRFDIAPGSIVQIETKAENFADGSDALATPMIAYVERVSVNINAEARAANTTFQFSHVRTSRENTLPRTMVTEHPLYKGSIYNGAPLVDDEWLFGTTTANASAATPADAAAGSEPTFTVDGPTTSVRPVTEASQVTNAVGSAIVGGINAASTFIGGLFSPTP